MAPSYSMRSRRGIVRIRPRRMAHVYEKPKTMSDPRLLRKQCLTLDFSDPRLLRDGIHVGAGGGPDRLGLPDVGPALAESGDRLQAVMDGGGDHLVFDAPPEEPHH